jgi:hypothetical protein
MNVVQTHNIGRDKSDKETAFDFREPLHGGPASIEDAKSAFEASKSEFRSKASKQRSNKTKSRESRSIGFKSVERTKSQGQQRSSGGNAVFGTKSRGSRGSQSPSQVHKLMSDLTHGKVKIKENTALLINATEVLTNKGITGDIHKVGLGFGTGRHTSGRRVDLYEEVKVT